MRRLLAALAVCLTSCIVTHECPRLAPVADQCPVARAHLSIDWIESSMSDSGETTGWYLTNAGPGVALIDKLEMCYDRQWRSIDSGADWRNATLEYELFDRVAGTVFDEGEPLGPTSRVPLMALDLPNWDLFDPTGTVDAYTDDETYRAKIDRIKARDFVAWRVSYRSADDDTPGTVTKGYCEK